MRLDLRPSLLSFHMIARTALFPSGTSLAPILSRLIIDGDSVMANNPGARMFIEGYLGDRLQLPDGYQQAVGGQTSGAILAGLQATIDLIVPGQTIVLVGPIGANQDIASNDFGEIVSDMDDIFSQLLSAGATVVAIPTLPDGNGVTDQLAKKAALAEWVRAYGPGGTVTFEGSDYPLVATSDFYVVDTTSFDPATMKVDQSHPNGLGGLFLANAVLDVVNSLNVVSTFETGANLLPGNIANLIGNGGTTSTNTSGDVATGWTSQATGDAWVLSKNGSDQQVASITNAAAPAIMTLRTDMSSMVSGVEGDIFDFLAAIEVGNGSTGVRGVKVTGVWSGQSNQQSLNPPASEFATANHPLFPRTQQAALLASATAGNLEISLYVDAGATASFVINQAMAIYVANVSNALEITGAPAVSGQVGETYSFVPTVTGGTPPYVFDLASGQLPGGLSLTPSTGAITGTLTSQETQSGIALRVTDAASDSATLSPFTLEVTAASVPVNTGLPTLSGAPEVGAVLSCAPGSWTNSPTGYAYQWRSSGFVLTGETASTYTIVAGDVGQTLTCDVIASNANGAGSVASSLATGVVTSPGAIAAWDSSLNSPAPQQLAYSDNGRTVTATADIAGMRHTRGADTLSGKVYFEVEAANEVSRVGVGTASVQYASSGTVVHYFGNYVSYSGGLQNMNGALANGDLVQVAVDTGAGRIWFRNHTKGGDWNGSPTADPATGTDGLTVANLSSFYAYTALKNNSGAQAILHGTTDRFLATPPTGFGPIQ